MIGINVQICMYEATKIWKRNRPKIKINFLYTDEQYCKLVVSLAD
jgi:hypothetical protein